MYRVIYDEKAAVNRVLATEREKLAQIQVQHEAAARKLRVAEDDLKAKDEELEKLRKALAQCQDELSQKSIKLVALESGSNADGLSAVFIEAQKSADLLVENAKKDAAELELNSRKLAENIIIEANNEARTILFEAEKTSSEKIAQMENRLKQLEVSTGNVRSIAFQEVIRLSGEVASLQAIFESFQQNGVEALADSARRLAEAGKTLQSGGIPEYKMHEEILPELPDEPVMEKVEHVYFTGIETDEPVEAASAASCAASFASSA